MQLSQPSQLLKTCQSLFARELNPEETAYWAKFLSEYSLAELRYAFENWNRNGRWFPKPKDISDLCEAYKVETVNSQSPIGCERCDWTGFYEVRRRGVQRFMADCPCRKNVSLRTPKRGQLASREEVAAMVDAIKRLAADKSMDKAISKPKQVSGIVPTTRELAEQLAKRGHTRLLGGKE